MARPKLWLHATKTAPLWRNQWICKALEELEDLKLHCIDTGMSYAERAEKREEEIDAFAACFVILDDENVEPECQNK